MIILKVTKKQGSPSLQKIHFWKDHRGRDQIDPPPNAVLALNTWKLK